MAALLRQYDLTPARLLFLAGLGAFFALFMLYPLAYVLANAFWVEGRFTLTFFWLMVSEPNQWALVLNSLNLGLAVTAATTLLSVPIAWAMVRFDFRGKSICSGLLLVPLVIVWIPAVLLILQNAQEGPWNGA